VESQPVPDEPINDEAPKKDWIFPFTVSWGSFTVWQKKASSVWPHPLNALALSTNPNRTKIYMISEQTRNYLKKHKKLDQLLRSKKQSNYSLH
jgi:hypothetical protein